MRDHNYQTNFALSTNQLVETLYPVFSVIVSEPNGECRAAAANLGAFPTEDPLAGNLAGVAAAETNSIALHEHTFEPNPFVLIPHELTLGVPGPS